MSDPTTRLREQRRVLVGRSPTQQGLDGVTLLPPDHAAGPAGSTDVFVLELHFVPGREGKPAIPPSLERGNVRVIDPEGHPAEGLEVVEVDRSREPDALTARVVLRARDLSRAHTLATDPRPFRVRLVRVPHLDPLFTSALFRFSGPIYDGQGEDEEGAPLIEGRPPRSEPRPGEIDYLAKDYESFRTLLLDQMAATAPGWRERNPSDLGVTVVEVLAYAADSLSYFQDAVATEAYLWTARRRLSVRRHARLVGYLLGEGLNARTWVRFTVEESAQGQLLPRGTQVLTRAGDLPPAITFPSPEYERALAAGSRVFETQSSIYLYSDHQEMHLHAWGAEDYTLPEGATEAALLGQYPHLAAGDALVIEETAGEHRWVVRLAEPPRLDTDPAVRTDGRPTAITRIRWRTGDALPFAIAVAARVRGEPVSDLAIVRGNLVEADHGRTALEPLIPVPVLGCYEALLRWPHLTFQKTPDGPRPVVTLIEVDPALFDPDRPANPDEGAVWQPRPDLLGSDGSARHFVVEMESDGRALLRFGDGRYGRRPAAGTCFWAVYRVGNGPEGNVGAEAIAHVVTSDPLVTGATNPVAAHGGMGRESLDHARLHAPPLLDLQDRCVADEDFEIHALLHPEVLAARVLLQCTALDRAAVLFVQRRGGLPVDDDFCRQVEQVMGPFLIAGDHLEVRPAIWAPLEVHLDVQTASSRLAGMVERRLRRAFDGREPLSGDEAGFFYPDRFTFGQPVYLSQIIEHAMRVAGVEEVVPRTFRRWGDTGEGGLVSGRIEVGPLEIVRVADQPQAPQLGTLRLTVGGPS